MGQEMLSAQRCPETNICFRRGWGWLIGEHGRLSSVLRAKFIKKIRMWRFVFWSQAKKTKCILIQTFRSPDFSAQIFNLQQNQHFAHKETPLGKPQLLAPTETGLHPVPSHPIPQTGLPLHGFAKRRAQQASGPGSIHKNTTPASQHHCITPF